MEHQDNLFEQFKKAAENTETKDFPGFEKIWSRLDAKLDTQVYKQQKSINSGWKKFAVAASVIVGTIFAYQFLKEGKTVPPIQNTVVVKEAVSPQPKEAAIITTDSNPVIINEKEAEKILEKQIRLQSQVATVVPIPHLTHNDSLVLRIPATVTEEEHDQLSSNVVREKTYETIGVKHPKSEERITSKHETESKKQAFKKAPPLVIVDGKVAKNDSEVSNAETVMELEEPLYIINGVEYTEKEMFGPNPTSPYFPLNKQEIESIIVYEAKEAIEKFGQKGAKGVVVVKTKDGRPTQLKK